MPRFSETARERELFRYYQPVEYTKLPLGGTPPARSSADTALTAFAQLGALRLNATRCIISLVGSKSEYVLAEASKTLSLQNDKTHELGDELLHGEGAMKARSEIGSALLALLTGDPETAPTHVIVNDLAEDVRFHHLPAGVLEIAKSMVCFPLRTVRGYVIGLYCVFDDKARGGFSDVEIQFLKDMAITTMDHIESNRVRQRHDRAEKMVKALAIFLEGGESLREWWLNQAAEGRSIQQSHINEQSRRGHTHSQQADDALGIQDGPDRSSATRLHELPADFLSQIASKPKPPPVYSSAASQRPPISRQQSDVSTVATTAASSAHGTNKSVFSDISSAYTHASAAQSLQSTQAPTLATRLAEPDLANLPGKELQEALLSADVKRSFSRASNLLREAVDLDGVAFYDASVGGFGARSMKEQKAPGAHTLDSLPETTSSGSDSRDSDGTSAFLDGAVEASVLGYSTRSRSSLKNHANSEMLGHFPEPLLRLLAKRHPHGKVFNFEDDGSISSSDIEGRNTASDTTDTSQNDPDAEPVEPHPEAKRRNVKKLLSRQAEGAAILKIIPGARSVAFFPLWDAASERWYAGALVWSMSSARVLCPEDELTYMAAWGNSIMAEVSRLSALVASRMKVDFVSSISHELRSPLHGILASVEFLQEDESIPALQMDMINTINSCGKTLLDTINHVLDFAKVIKNTTKKPVRTAEKRLRAARRASPDHMNELSDICVLAEEVIDSVYAGRRLNKTASSKSPVSAAVIVILNISYETNWNFKLNIGAFRRVLMNVFSNALKYTEAGFVKVSISLSQEPAPREGKPRPVLNITVSDSGKGISQEFLKDHLYTAFKQEDALSVGTGLGLSIVRQVLLDVRGTIEIESELRSGTKATVCIPVKPSSHRSPQDGSDTIAEVKARLTGTRARILNEGFNIYPNMSDAPTGILSPESQALIHLKSSVQSLFTNWFGMEMVTSSDNDKRSADVIVVVASDDIRDKISAMEEGQSEVKGGSVVVALCDVSYRGVNFTTDHGTRVSYLRLPVTPHKLATILHAEFCSPQDSTPVRPSLPLRTSTNATITDFPTITPDSPIKRPAFNRRKSSKTPAPHLLPPNKYKTLLVEDNAINLKLLTHYMAKLSQPYTTATNGLEAVVAYKEFRGDIDIIFMDLQMPTMDGLVAAREIRRYEAENGVQGAAIVALTGAAGVGVRQEAFSSGMDLFLVKPVRMGLLMDVMVLLSEGGREALRNFG